MCHTLQRGNVLVVGCLAVSVSMPCSIEVLQSVSYYFFDYINKINCSLYFFIPCIKACTKATFLLALSICMHICTSGVCRITFNLSFSSVFWIFDLSFSSSIFWIESVAIVLRVSSVLLSVMMSLLVVISKMHWAYVNYCQKKKKKKNTHVAGQVVRWMNCMEELL